VNTSGPNEATPEPAGAAAYQAEPQRGGVEQSGPAGGEPSRAHEPRLHAVPSPAEEPAFENIPEPPEDPYGPYDDVYDPEGGARMDDANAANSALVGLPLVEKMFGAKVIEDTSKGK
ncbi:MAG: hypothetical protein Q4E01_06910, partial [Actinomycetaceae bacterium]|nr:hypothetical protein [Actinomycetaceae bacterium]